MDFQRPVEAVIPGVQGRILAVLADTTVELNLRTIARLASVSPAQASRVLPDLVTLGLVVRREVPPSALFTLAEDHVAARAVRALSRSRQRVLEDLGTLAGKVDPSPIAVVLFGSFARGEADAASDLDVILVRPAGVGEDDEPWVSSVEAWRSAARQLTGNTVQMLEIDESDVARRLRRPTSLWADVLREGITLYGAPLDQLKGRRTARQARTRRVSAAQARSYVSKAEEYLAAATSELDADRTIAATSLAVHGLCTKTASCTTSLGSAQKPRSQAMSALM